jgi:hypothetical protein
MSLLFCNAMEHQLHITSVNQAKDYTCYILNKKLCGVAYPSNDTVLALSENYWSTFDSKTGLLKRHSPFEGFLRDFDISDGSLVIGTSNEIFRFDLSFTGKNYFGYFSIATENLRRIAFFPDDKGIAVFTHYGGLFIATQNKLYQFKRIPAYSLGKSSFAVKPKSEEVLLLNTKRLYPLRAGDTYLMHTAYTFSTDEKIETETDMESYDNNDALSCIYNSKGTMLAIQTTCNGYVFYKVNGKKYTFHRKFDSIHKKAACIKLEIPCFSALAFHPFKLIVALMNQCNNTVEFHSYAENDNTLLTTVALDISESFFDKFASNKHIAFSPDGKNSIALNKRDNKFYIIPTPFDVYYNKNIRKKCVFLNFILNNYNDSNNHIFIPQDIKKLIFNSIAYSTDF